MEKIKHGLVGVVCFGLVACVGSPVKTEVVTQPLEPAGPPKYQVGDKFFWNVNGEPQINEVIAVIDGNVSWKQNEKESWIEQGPIVYPAKSWKSEEFGDGTLTINSVKGELFPLTLGSSVSILARGEIENDEPWDDERNCTVESEERVTVPMGSFDTFKIYCKGNYVNRTWYYSPELQTPVVYVRYHKSKHKTKLFELTGIERS